MKDADQHLFATDDVSEPDALLIGPNEWVPNNPRLPVLVYRGVVPAGDPEATESTLRANGWRSDWRDGVYRYHHYHSTAHEAPACTDGAAQLMVCGEDATRLDIAAGDLLVLPAGTGHCRIHQTDNFLLVGAYPDGQDWDVCREEADGATRRRIAAVPLPIADPVAGGRGPLTRLWKGQLS